MKNVINSIDKDDAIKSAKRLKAYYPSRIVGVVDMHGKWGYLSGKTMAKFNRLAKSGYAIYLVQ